MTETPLIITASIAIDRLMNINGRYSELIQPDKLDSLAVFPFVNSLTDAFGGVAGNIAYSLALLGDQPILLGSVGRDAQIYMDKLQADGVDLSHLHTSEQATATFTCLTDQAQSQIGGFYPGAMSDADSLSLAPWQNAAPVVLVGPHDPAAMKRQVQECKRWGLRLVYDIGQQVSNLQAEDMREGIEAAHVLILNDFELAALCKATGRSGEEIKRSVPIVVTTLGKDGSRIEGAEVPEPLEIGIARPDHEIDPTGAGDAFRAGFLHGFVRGWSLGDCARLGAVTGSYALEHGGTQQHRFTLTDVAARYQTNFNQPLPA